MIVVNTETIPGHDILEIKGLVQGNTIRAKHLGRDICSPSRAARPWIACWGRLASWGPTRS